jgi:hypothetical protein
MDAHYIWFAFYEKCIKSLSVLLICLVNFQNRAAIKKKRGHYGFKAYPYSN